MAHLVGAQGQVKLSIKAHNTPTYDVIHREPQTQIKKLFFQLKLEDLTNL